MTAPKKKPTQGAKPGANPPTIPEKPHENPAATPSKDEIKALVSQALNEMNLGGLITEVAETKVKEGMADLKKSILEVIQPPAAVTQESAAIPPQAAQAPQQPAAQQPPPQQPQGGGLSNLMTMLPMLQALGIIPSQTPAAASPLAGMGQFFETMRQFNETARSLNPMNDAVSQLTGFMKLALTAGADPLKAVDAVEQTFNKKPQPQPGANNGTAGNS
jgi:hypothetical protein